MANFNPVNQKRGKTKVSKRIGLIVALAMVLVLVATTGAFAAQNLNSSKNGYEATPSVLTPDGTTQYPNEIYLPNETNPVEYRIHSNYTATTDACASCHSTHTAVGASLLQWGTVYDTCMACHDGSITTTYNVKGGEIAATGKTTFAGMFGDGTEASASKHNVTGEMQIYSAPGGFGVTGGATAANTDSYGKQKSWDVEFGCQSCHSPHGQGGNPRLLNPDANGTGWSKYNAGTTKNTAVTVNAGVGTTDYNADGIADTWIQGYPYSEVTKLYDGGVEIPATNYTLSNLDGTTKVTFTVAPTGAVTADFVPAMVVKMNITNYLQNNEDVQHVAGLNTFCGACHTDYNTQAATNAGSKLTGTYTEAYRHQVGMTGSNFNLAGTTMKLESGKVTCETCHVAHGTNTEYWQANGVAADNAVEIGGSSALKRLPNMGTCETCHQKGKGNEGYVANTGLASAGIVGTANPTNQGNATYVGSAACQKCHTKNYTGWQDTLHSKMVKDGASTILPAAKVDDNTWLGSTTLARNADGTTFTPSQVLKTLGSKWKQRYLVAPPAGQPGQYTFLSKQFNITSGAFEAYGNKTSWDLNCATCHTTGYKVTAQDAGTLQDTAATWTEFNVGCEACHGPGSKHVSTPNSYTIWNPAKQSVQDSSKSCGYCHIRGENEEHKTLSGAAVIGREDLPAPVGETHQPWDFSWTTQAMIPGVDGVTSFADYAPGGTGTAADVIGAFKAANGSGKYDEAKHHQQYQGFIQAAGHNATMSCASCHSSHSRNADKAQLKILGKDLCSSCHGTQYSITQNMTRTGKTVNNVYVRNHTFSAVPTAEAGGTLNVVNP
jgi:predicted CXXCH cytochrome family protein